MSDAETRQIALERLLRPLVDGRIEVVVTYRRFEDYEAYEEELATLRAERDRLKQDMYAMALNCNQYLQTLDEVNRLKRILRKNKISF